jgi:hypothetical protein
VGGLGVCCLFVSARGGPEEGCGEDKASFWYHLCITSDRNDELAYYSLRVVRSAVLAPISSFINSLPSPAHSW